ncbi:FHA domain-containing protein [Vallitalea guaymasensis]|uniref:FHA domain-containing protein n=1 Tax=Vallitalea guaymasensis TaxID=1185412 RepID=UPI00187D3385|nr:FHA domain-containing protein [Vallitalea guaymasensis]
MASLLACIGMLLAVNLYSSKKAYDYMKNKEGKNNSINMNKKKVYNEPSVNSFNVEYKNRAKLFEEPVPEEKKSKRDIDNPIEEKSNNVRQKMVIKQGSTDYSTEDTILLEDYKQKLNIEAEPYLLSKDGDIVNKVIISSNPFIIGKLDSQVDHIIENSSVSRIHCKIIEEDGQYYIIDLNSKNGTYLDEERLVSNKRYQLHDGTHVAISNCEYTFEIN